MALTDSEITALQALDAPQMAEILPSRFGGKLPDAPKDGNFPFIPHLTGSLENPYGISDLWYNKNSLESCSNNSPSLTNSIFCIGENKMAVKNISKICSVVDCENRTKSKGFCIKHYERWFKYGSPFITIQNKGEGKTHKERFWSRVALTADDQRCWEWQGWLSKAGYGYVGFNGKSIGAHRIAWFYTYGKLPDLCLLHSCDNPSCVNPKHLREGTKAENTADMMAKHRHYCGERTKNAKLTSDVVKTIRQTCQLTDYALINALAKKYNIGRDAIIKVIKRESWKHIE